MPANQTRLRCVALSAATAAGTTCHSRAHVDPRKAMNSNRMRPGTGLAIQRAGMRVLIAMALLLAAPGSVAADPTPDSSSRMLELLSGFRFGTYGRVGLSGDLQHGSMGRSVNVVSHGPRLEEPPYVELDLGYLFERAGSNIPSFRVVSTLAFLEDFFHYNGRFDARIALRNLFVEATNVLTPHLSLWVGSRMYRGDDIYLLDYWPLDNLNTLGGGAGLTLGHTRLDLHAGVNRLEDDYQFQTIEVPDPRIGTDAVVVLDRQRTVVSLRATHQLPHLLGPASVKVMLYGEVHHIPSGTLRREPDYREALPSDLGWVAGTQLGLWGLGQNGSANLWLRAAGGLAAYGEMAIPFGQGSDKRSTDAREVVLALSANYERGLLGLMAGGYLRYFRDADGIVDDPDDGWEYVAALRPHLFFNRYLQGVFELSYQGRRPNGLDPDSQSHLVPGVFKFSVIPTLSWDRGTYSRPQLRLVYTVSYLDQGAQLSFPREDPRRGVAVHHFLGAQVEWWYNSSYR